MTDHTVLILYYFLDQIRMTYFAGISYFLHIWKLFAQTPSKNSDFETQISVKKNSNLKVAVETTGRPPMPMCYLRGWNGSFKWLFYKNMKDAFNEGLPHIIQFFVLGPFLRGPQILLTFTRHLAFTRSNLIKQKKLVFSFE